MWARTVAVIAVLASTAAAEALDVSLPYEPEPAPVTHRLGIGHPGFKVAFDKVAVQVQQEPLGLTANVTMVVSTTEKDAREAVIALEIPRGAQVTGVALTIGNTERMVGTAATAERAAVEYQQWFDRGKDPVLVQWKSERPEGDVLEIRAFPLTRTEPGRIELTIELPQIAALTVDVVAPTVEVIGEKTYRKVKRPIVVAVPVRREVELPLVVARPAVSKATSLYAGFAPSMPVPPTVMIGSPSSHRRSWPQSVDARDIRREVKRHIARLGRCYEKVIEYRGGIEGDAMLHFLIGTSGKIESVNVYGTITDERIKTCLAEVVATFEFRAGDGAVLVNYPLRLRIAAS